LGFVWKILALSKIIAFSLQLLLRRLPTLENLAKWGVVDIRALSFCVLCPMNSKSEGRLFGGCAFASTLWRKVFNWFGWDDVAPRDPRHILQRFNVGRGNGKGLKGLLAVWHVVVWAIWRVRNDVIFNSKVPIIEDVLNGIISFS
jgi:hypothetical protein